MELPLTACVVSAGFAAGYAEFRLRLHRARDVRERKAREAESER